MKAAHHTPTRTKRERPAAAATAPAEVVLPELESREEFVRRTAYAYYEARGRIHGHELDDWLEAEAEFERLTEAKTGAGATGH
jgi:hypothetical protein